MRYTGLRYITTQEPWQGERINGIAHNWKIGLPGSSWTQADLAAIGLEKVPPPEPVDPPPPSTDPNDFPLNKVQFHAMVGILAKKTAIETAIAGIPDDTQRAIAEAKYLHSDRFDRNDALFDALAPAVWPDLTEAERNATIDAAWMQAKEIA